jgi:imidazolonepropionase-like amidohydrolase
LLIHALIGLIFGLSSAGDPSAPATPKPKPKPLVIKAGRLFDGIGDVHRAGQVVVIEGERITAVGPAGQVKVPEGADVIDLSGAVVLPGLIDAHTHIGSRADR